MPPFLYNILLVILGFLPSLIWLNFYYREDCHPEPKTLLAKVFLMGIIISPIAIVLQLISVKCSELSIHNLCFPTGIFLSSSPEFFLWSAFVEEMVKYYAVRIMVIKRPEFDEPIDAMIYMMTASLGFAAIENTLIAFQTTPDGVAVTVNTLLLRFVGATLLHALSSGLLGYFLAISWFFQNHRKKLLVVGIFLATLFHFTFNMLIFIFDGQVVALLYTTSLLLAMAFLVSVLFDKLKDRTSKAPFAIN